MMMKTQQLLALGLALLVTGANAAGFLQEPTASNSSDSAATAEKKAEMDVENLREQVVKADMFQQKVQFVCDHATNQEACETKATSALFCQLLQRSKPEMVKDAHCHSSQKPASLLQKGDLPAPQGSLADMKKRIVASADFKKQTARMSLLMGCGGVRKADNCNGFVQDIAFCLAFADQIGRFANMQGVHEEQEYCKTIDKKMPQLAMLLQSSRMSFVQVASHSSHLRAPEDDLAKEMTHDLEMNFNKIAPFGKEDTAKELQDHAAKTQDTLVDAVENAEVAEIKRAVFRALTRLRAATIKEFDTIARLETQAIDAYNDAHHYRAENPLAHLHEDEAPVETDKLKSFH